MHHKTYSIEQLKNKILYYINYRIRSQQEIIHKLTSLHASQEQICVLVEELEQIGLINDEKLIVFFIQDYIETKQYGLSRVTLELRKKGFSSPLIQSALEDYYAREDYDPIRQAYNLIAQKYRLKLPEDQKILAFLARRGFSYSIAQKALTIYKTQNII
ncbi:MAG: regulatory protein RecX [Brevinema sp.]